MIPPSHFDPKGQPTLLVLKLPSEANEVVG